MVAHHLHQQSRAPEPKSCVSPPPLPAFPLPPPPPTMQTQPERQDGQERPRPSPKRRKTHATIRQQAPLQSPQARHRKPPTSRRRTPHTELVVDHSTQLGHQRQQRWQWQQQRGAEGNPRQPGIAVVARKPRGRMVDWLILVCSKAARRSQAAGAAGSDGRSADTGKVFLGQNLQRMVRQGWRVLPCLMVLGVFSKSPSWFCPTKRDPLFHPVSFILEKWGCHGVTDR